MSQQLGLQPISLTRAAPHLAAVPTLGQLGNTANRLTSVNLRTRKGTKQRNREVQQPLLLFTMLYQSLQWLVQHQGEKPPRTS